MGMKRKLCCTAAIAGVSLYIGAWVLCLGNTYSMSPVEYAEQAQQIIECSLAKEL